MDEHSTRKARKSAVSVVTAAHGHTERAILLQVLHHLVDGEDGLANVYFCFVFELVRAGDDRPIQ